ncbi:tyrosine-specific transport protein isoform X3 [Gossypium hirsutum]|uniref:Tyrosine-specific transport protein isoform X3 n=1 Tax=Gossypium hirsutum TaxID=3635 RepID=A0A1U8KTV5_GOSHI|nr:tyrosine-specific transport protein-like isoform X3 [Gossypium hirsutum]
MDTTKCMTSSSSLTLKAHIKNATIISKSPILHRKRDIFCLNIKISKKHPYGCQYLQKKKKPWRTHKIYVTKEGESVINGAGKKGTIAGAVALIVGTSIGSGILALPQKASPAGVVPSSISLVVCWAFLLIEALLLIEINVGLQRKRKEGELEVISIRTMAQETLGDWGGNLATVTYIFLGYTSMIAYSSKSGEILFHLINLPEPASGFLFTALFTFLISVGGTQVTDQVNQWLTVSMIGLLMAIEVVAVMLGGWSGLEGNGDWGKVPATIPVMIFSLVYHDVAPVLCAYLGSDLTRLRASVLLGSLFPLLALLVWDAIALGISTQTDQVVDPVELLMGYVKYIDSTCHNCKIPSVEEYYVRVKWSGVSFMVEAFSLLAVGTSMTGTLLSFSEFFKEQLKNLSWHSSSVQIKALALDDLQQEPDKLTNWWGRNKTRFTAMAMVVTPTLIVSTTVPEAFSAATDIAGGYCMTMLYGVLPPAMAWAMGNREGEGSNQKGLTMAWPAICGVGLFACGLVMEQILQDLLALQF